MIDETPECHCLTPAKAISAGLHGKPVPRCELHGTLGSAGKQADTEAEALALNSEALENKFAGSLGAALNKPRFLDL